MKRSKYKEVQKIFQAAVELQTTARRAFLDEACLGDKVLRREVEGLLAADDAVFMEKPAVAQFEADFELDEELITSVESIDESRIGERFGHYKVIRLIGHGGMGEVYLAEDTLLEREVAIKFLRKKLNNDPENLRRFLGEAKAASALNHPNIITVYEIGMTQGMNFIATEFIEGESLHQRLMDDGLPIDEILDIAVQVARGLSIAHKAGIIHRDIKPDNLVIRKDGIVKILDFGLAKLAQARGGAAQDLEIRSKSDFDTLPGMIMGTPQYMSPEQARGERIDHRTDIFSFGVVLYRMISGKLPFSGQTAKDIISSVLSVEPPPLAQLTTNVPHGLMQICQKSLCKSREGRFKSADELLNELKDLQHESIDGPKVHNPSRIGDGQSKSIKSHEKVSEEPRSDALLMTEFHNLTGDDVFDGTLRLALALALEQSPFLEIFPEPSIQRALHLMGRSIDESVTRQIGREICLRKGLKAYVTGTISRPGRAYVLTLEAINAHSEKRIGQYSQKTDSKEGVIKALGLAATGLRKQLGESLRSIDEFEAPLEEASTASLEALRAYSRGHNLMINGKPYDAIRFSLRAIEIDPKFAYAYAGLAILYQQTRQLSKAIEFITKAYDLRERVSKLERFQISAIYYVLVTGELEKAISTLLFWKEVYPREKVYGTLSHCYGQLGRFDEAVNVGYEGLSVNSRNSIVHGNLAFSLVHLNRLEESKKVIETALKLDFDSFQYHQVLFWIAFIEGDEPELNSQLNWFDGSKADHLAFELRASAAGFRGMWRSAQEFSDRAVAMALTNESPDSAADYCASHGLRIALSSFCNEITVGSDRALKMSLEKQINRALQIEPNKEILCRSTLAFAFGGLLSESTRLIRELTLQYPNDTVITKLWLPVSKAILALHEQDPKKALVELKITKDLERAGEFCPQYVRGLAYLKLDRFNQARAEFRKILDGQGESPLSPIYALAHLGKARATRVRKDYEKFFELWRLADQDTPMLIEARKECASL